MVLTFTMFVTIFFSTVMLKSWGYTKMQREADFYGYKLSEWMTQQKSILDMFVNTIEADPTVLEDYDKAVAFLDDITDRYPEISVTYMTNPEAEHTVIMNNGWIPDANWRVEERQWYIDTIDSPDGFNISAPYYDEQTGLYCVTFSERVYNRKGEFIGNFGIDFYLDKLTEILGKSYMKDGYAFLVDGNGTIINHRNEKYQLTSENSVNIAGLCYGEAEGNAGTMLIKDYDDKYRVCIFEDENSSNFRVFVVKDWWSIYGNIVLYDGLLVLLFGICIITVAYLIRKMVQWQTEVNERLKQAADAAVSAGKAKSQFLAQMSHEIRTPINAVLGMNEMILRETEDEEIREYSENIKSAGNTLLTVINSILDFSKIEDGKMEIIPVRYDTGSVINDLINMISDKAEKKGLDLKLEIDENLPRILYGDDVRIRQVITNLLTNAVKYTPQGSVTLKIKEIDRSNENGDIVLKVEVTDTGIGIRKEDMGKLFDSFQRLDEEKNRNIEGTGLGISIVQKLLLMMGSRLNVSSVYGEGSNFNFALTQKIVEAEPIGNYELRRQKSLEKKEQNYIYAPEAKLLIVDDNQMNLKVASGLLKRSGMQIDTITSGKECIKMAQEKAYDVIFLDHMMPEMDGFETLKELKEHPGCNVGTPVVAMTANAIVGAREEYLGAGFDDYIAKPIVINELEKVLQRYLDPNLVSIRNVEQIREGKEKEEDQEDTFAQEELLELRAEFPELDVLTGLTYCAGSRSFYKEMLGEYCKNEKTENIKEFYEKKDWENYRVLVHALKSTSLSIGAVELSDLAKRLEQAAKEGRSADIEELHPVLMQTYEVLIHKLEGVSVTM